MTTMTTTIEAELERLSAIADPIERARELGKLIPTSEDLLRQVRLARAAAVAEANVEHGLSYPRIAEALDINESNIQHLIQTAGVRRRVGRPPRKG
jgi:biotin operon repressor